MPVIESEIVLNVPADTLFGYLRNPARLMDYCTNVISISDIQQHPASSQFAWEYRMCGVHLLGEATLEETRKNESLMVRFTGGVDGTAQWYLHHCDEGCLLQLRIDYVVPPPLERKHSTLSIVKQNEESAALMLKSLETLLVAHHV